MAYRGVAYIVVAYMVMADIAMAYMVTGVCSYGYLVTSASSARADACAGPRSVAASSVASASASRLRS